MVVKLEKGDENTCCCRCCFNSGGNPNWLRRRWKLRRNHNYQLRGRISFATSENNGGARNHYNNRGQDYHQPHELSGFESTPNQTRKSDPEEIGEKQREDDDCGKVPTTCDDYRGLMRQRLPPNHGRGLKMPTLTTFRLTTGTHFLVTFFLLILLGVSRSVDAFPTNDCDWSGSGTPANLVQAVYLRCHQGHVFWERPKGGLRVNISPPKYFKALGERDQPFRLCLETTAGSHFQVFLEQSSRYSSSGEPRRQLLPFIAPKSKSSTCYRIDSPTATLYVESQNQENEEVGTATTPSSQEGPYQHVKISYEIEEIIQNSQQRHYSDDECRPCSNQEVLQLYCVADVVARGEILSVRPSSNREGMDAIHIKSDLVVHQNHPVFRPWKEGNQNVQKFLASDTSTFDADSPSKILKQGKSSKFGGIILHPTKCAAQNGPGEFLWLIKLSFGRPKVGCVLYWDKWVQLAKEAQASGEANCQFVTQ